MDSIMQYTAGLATAFDTFWFAVTFLAGIWIAARYGKAALVPSIIVGVAVCYIRFVLNFEPLSTVAALCMGGLHIASGVWLGLLFNRGKKAKAQSDVEADNYQG